MTPDDLIKHFGTQVAAAAALDVSQPSVWEWLRNGSIPYLRQLDIERVTQGALRANPADLKRDLAKRKRKPSTEAAA